MRLVLLRHGESTWNRENRFTGWEDVDLSDKGVAEAEASGRFLAEAGIGPDVVHTSLLLRAIRTADLALAAADRDWIPVRRSWRLNGRLSHGNTLRALVKHLESIPDDQIAGLDIPTGIPLLYELGPDLRPDDLGGQYLDPHVTVSGRLS